MDKLTKGQRTKIKILEEALRLFTEKGFEATSFRQIGDACSMSQQGVMGHFNSKLDLFKGIIEKITYEIHETLSKTTQPSHDAYDNIMNHYSVQLELLSKNPAYLQIFSLMYYYSCFDKEMKTYYTSRVQNFRFHYETYLFAGLREGLFKFDESPAQIAELLQESLMSNLIHYGIEGRKNQRSKSIEKWDRIVKKLTGYKGRKFTNKPN